MQYFFKIIIILDIIVVFCFTLKITQIQYIFLENLAIIIIITITLCIYCMFLNFAQKALLDNFL